MSEASPGPVAAKNTDTHLWPQASEDFYAPRIFATAGGGIGIDVGGHVIVKPLREWHRLAALPASQAGQPVLAERHPGPFTGPDAELARACAMVTIPDYGNDDPDTHQRIMRDGIWNDHIAVQSALTAIHSIRKAAPQSVGVQPVDAESLRTFDTTGTVLNRSCNVFTLNCPYPIMDDWSVRACIKAANCGCNNLKQPSAIRE